MVAGLPDAPTAKMVMLPVRELVLLLAAYETLTVPLLVPFAPDVIVSHPVDVDALQPIVPLPAFETLREKLPAAEPTFCVDDGETESTGVDPFETSNPTEFPCETTVFAFGFWLITFPGGTIVLYAYVTAPTVRFAPVIAVRAAASVIPMTFGTVTSCCAGCGQPVKDAAIETAATIPLSDLNIPGDVQAEALLRVDTTTFLIIAFSSRFVWPFCLQHRS